MIVETKHAQLSTLSVTIQALHVSGKQLTLAVFRQLPIQLDTDDADHWGVVRYAIKDEGDIWLVFSLGGILYRRALRPESDKYITSSIIYTIKNDIQDNRNYLSQRPEAYWPEEHKRRRIEIARLEALLVESIDNAERERARAAIDAGLIATLLQLFIAV